MILICLYNITTAPRLENAAKLNQTQKPLDNKKPLVSLLIPVRNEAQNLKKNLPWLLTCDYENLEILFLNDESTDDTASLLSEFQKRSKASVTILHGQPLPAGWIGKTWACQQLATKAKGSILIFCDADVTVHSLAISNTITTMGARHCDVLTALPRQQLKSVGEIAIIPLVISCPILGLLPLRLVECSKLSSTTLCNGQWIALKREAYDAIGGHESIKDKILEDMAIGYAVKKHGFKLSAVLAHNDLHVQMYHDWKSVRQGFSKNLYLLMGNHWLPFVIINLLFCISFITPWILPVYFIFSSEIINANRAVLPLALLLIFRILISITTKQGFASVLLHPLGSLMVFVLFWESAWCHATGSIQWKQRHYKISQN